MMVQSPNLYLRISHDPQCGTHCADSFICIVTRQACYNFGSSALIHSHVADGETKAQWDWVGCSKPSNCWVVKLGFRVQLQSPFSFQVILLPEIPKPHLADGETNAQRGEMTGSRSYQDWGQSLKLTPDFSPDSTHPGTGSRLLWAESSFPTTNYSLSHSPWAKLNLLMGKKMPGKHLLVGRLSLCTSLLPLNWKSCWFKLKTKPWFAEPLCAQQVLT